MKKKWIALLAAAVCLALCACGRAVKNDERFLAQLAMGLEARWKLSDTIDCTSESEYAQCVTDLVNAELEALGDLSEYVFKDHALEELAQQYHDALNSQLKGAPYYLTDLETYNSVFIAEGYNKRVMILSRLCADYGLTVSEEYADDLEEFCSVYDRFLAIDALMDQKLELTNLGGKYEITVKNTAPAGLEQICVRLRYLDDSGEIIDSDLCFLDNWASGSKDTLTFRAIDGEFSAVELSFESVYDYYATGWTEADYVNP